MVTLTVAVDFVLLIPPPVRLLWSDEMLYPDLLISPATLFVNAVDGTVLLLVSRFQAGHPPARLFWVLKNTSTTPHLLRSDATSRPQLTTHSRSIL
jgi:hypothetical protein